MMNPAVHPVLSSPSQPSAPMSAPRRGPSWAIIVLIAIAAGGAGTVLGTRLRSSPSASADPSPRAGMAGMPGMESAPPLPAGASAKAVYVSSARQQLVGVRTGTVTRQRVEGTVRTVGMLAYDETRFAQIHTRVSGWIEQLFVDYVGKPVRRGQALFAVYSPDLTTAQTDYLIALRARRDVAGGPIPEARQGADALLAASRERLKRWNVSDGAIAELERAGHTTRTVTLSSPFDGVVLEKAAFAGQYVTPEMTTFKLADLSSVWVIGPVISGVAEGDRVVTSAQFLIDSETNLMAAMQTMSASMPGMDMGASKPSAPSSAAPTASSRAPEMLGMPMPATSRSEQAPAAVMGTPRPISAPPARTAPPSAAPMPAMSNHAGHHE